MWWISSIDTHHIGHDRGRYRHPGDDIGGHKSRDEHNQSYNDQIRGEECLERGETNDGHQKEVRAHQVTGPEFVVLGNLQTQGVVFHQNVMQQCHSFICLQSLANDVLDVLIHLTIQYMDYPELFVLFRLPFHSVM